MRLRSAIFALLLLAALGLRLSAAPGNKAAILNSRHDFRATSTATIRSVSGQDACVFCHTPHNANPGTYLWNQTLSTRDFPGYGSSTLQATITPIQARDVSKLCLSCHDGTIALGSTVNDGLIPFVQGSGYTLPAGSKSNLAAGQGFSDDHPFAFVPVLGSEIRNPPPGDAVHLDGSGKVQCTSCHEPHEEFRDAAVGRFLVEPNPASVLCLSCHQKTGWQGSSHQQPPDPAEDVKYTSLQGAHTGYVGVSKNGCESCHRPHAPQVAQRLVKLPEENTCYQCHDGSVTNLNIKNEFLKTYKHPVQITPSVHDESESPSSAQYPLPETGSGALRHAECVDCHNPHAAKAQAAQPPQVTGALLGTRGQSADNAFLLRSANEYEICFKCHGDSANKPQLLDTGTVGVGFGRNPQRQFDAGNPNRYNTRMEFQFGVSYHPVTRARNLSSGLGGEVPSLRSAPISLGGIALPNRTLSPASYVYCSDCHNSDTGQNLGTAAGPAGPHGSNIPHLLERQNALEPVSGAPGADSSGVAYSASNYALCDKCHDLQGSILSNVSFKEHRMHIQEEHAACSTCHDPHSSSAPMLVNFDLSIVKAASNGQLQYTRTGVGHGTCTLTCHGEEHSAFHY